MDGVALGRRPLPRVAVRPAVRTLDIALLGALALGSLLLKAHFLDHTLGVDESLSVGIASFPLAEIPGALRLDGSPPLYYVLLHVWMDLFGTSEAAMHSLSLLFGLLTVPAGFWAAGSLFGRRAGWVCAGLCAVNPFITYTAHVTRMYSLVILLGLLAAGAFGHGFVHGRRRHVAAFAALFATLLYVHNWALFFGFGALIALIVLTRELPERRGELVRDGALAFGAAGLAYLPWLATLIYQAGHTGAPWSYVPPFLEIFRGLGTLLGGPVPTVAAVAAGAAGVAGLRRRGGPDRAAGTAIAVLGVSTLLIAWLSSQVSPAWALRYFAVLAGPFLILAAVGLSRAGRAGLVVLAALSLAWALDSGPEDTPANERAVLERFHPQLRPGDLVLSTQPERVPLLRYYLPPALTYATPMGVVGDPRLMDWRDAMPFMHRSSPGAVLDFLVANLPPGGNLLLVRPVTDNGRSWGAPWTSLVRRRSLQWAQTLAQDPRFEKRGVVPPSLDGVTNGVQAVLYVKKS